MKKVVYIYLLDTMAEWEIGNILQAFSMEKMLKKGLVEFEVKTLAMTAKPIRTLGGLLITPDCTLDAIDEENMVALLLPGADTWNDHAHGQILSKINNYLEYGILVAAICGATLALADLGILDKYKHTSNSLEYLEIFAKNYTGQKFYQDEPVYSDRNLITANSASGLQWAQEILINLHVYPLEIINLWYLYFETCDPKYYMKLMKLAG